MVFCGREAVTRHPVPTQRTPSGTEQEEVMEEKVKEEEEELVVDVM